MTWPMTLAGPPRAGAFSKLHDYKKKVQKMKGLLKKKSFNGKQFEVFKPKNQKIQSPYGEQNKRTTRPWRQERNMNNVARNKLTEAN